MQIKPEEYSFDGALELRNIGPEIKLTGHQQGEDPSVVIVPTGIRIKLPKGVQLIVQEKAAIANTRILVRNVPLQNEEGGEVLVALLNLGKHDALIPMGSKLPAQLLAMTVYNEIVETNYREYLDNTPNET
jgi:dUTPase